MQIIPKTEYLQDLANRMSEIATRKNRACAEEKYLIRDLDNIFQLVLIMEKVLASEQTLFRKQDIEFFELDLFHKDLAQMPKKCDHVNTCIKDDLHCLCEDCGSYIK